MRYAIIDQNNIVINSVLWDEISEYKPGEGLTLVRSDTAGIGDIYLNGVFSNA